VVFVIITVAVCGVFGLMIIAMLIGVSLDTAAQRRARQKVAAERQRPRIPARVVVVLRRSVSASDA
jgi:hypothetical protein